jgi:hypothetical protein
MSTVVLVVKEAARYHPLQLHGLGSCRYLRCMYVDLASYSIRGINYLVTAAIIQTAAQAAFVLADRRYHTIRDCTL